MECRDCRLCNRPCFEHPWYVTSTFIHSLVDVELDWILLNCIHFATVALIVLWHLWGYVCAGTPQALAQSCLSFGAFSFILDYMNHPRAPLAVTSHSGPNQMPVVNINMNFPFFLPPLPTFTLPPLLFTHPLTFQQLKPRPHFLGHQQQLHNDGATLWAQTIVRLLV